MDAIDRSILRELQADGRLTNQELAQRVGLTPSPCLRRVRQLEDDGVIQTYRAVVDPAAVGRGFEVFASVEVQRDRDSVAAFEAEVQSTTDVVEACCASRWPTPTPTSASGPRSSSPCRASATSTPR
jgi:DNA-binding Lrp family transcriptional regulator